MVATIYKGDLAEVTLGHETGIILTHGTWGGLKIGAATVAGSDITTLNFSGVAVGTSGSAADTDEMFFDASHQLKYPVGLLAGSKLTVIGDGNFSTDDHTKGHLYTIVANEGSTITVTPAMKRSFTDATCDYNNDPTVTMDSTTTLVVGMGVTGTGIPVGATVASITNATTFELSAATTGGAVTNGTLTFYGGLSASGDEFAIDALGTPTLDSTMGYNSSALLSDESVLTDQFVGLAATIALPETKVEVLRSPIVGVGRQVVVQQPQSIKNEGGSLETMMHSARWLYYALGNEAATTTNPANAVTVDTGVNIQAIAMGDTYIGLMRAGGNGAVSGALPAVGDYVTVEDTAEVLTPMDDDPGSGSRDVFSGTQSQFHSSQCSEIRRVIAVDTTNTLKRIYVDDPFNFDHTASNSRTVRKITLAANNATGSPNFDTADATYGNIQNRQSRALWSMWHLPSFSLETSIRTRDVGSYGTEQAANIPGSATDSKQLTRVYKGCKVKEWTLTAEADADVKMQVDFDALMCYTDTGRLENSNGGDRYTAHRMFENIADSPLNRKKAGIAPNTEKPFFFYNGTITAFGTAIAQVTNFSLKGSNGLTTHLVVSGNPAAEPRNTNGKSLEQIPFAGSRNPTLNVEGQTDFSLDMTILPTDPLFWHEFRTTRSKEYAEPITLHLVKDGAGDSREEIYIIIDDYILEAAGLSIPEDKGVIKQELKVLPRHVKVVAHDTLLHS
jgi:hypothetical protein|tara:strand:- start:227 stop:2416 length:2190 start_codon:yes stop_codon:yes gene_type:complete